jgi:fluoride exporter
LLFFAVLPAFSRVLNYLWISLGGALGTAARFWFSGVVANRFGETFPWGTLLVNVTGSLAIGFFATLTDPSGRLLIQPTARQFFMAGVCGGYTTFSSFSLQTLKLVQDKEWLHAGANVVGSVALCLFAVWLGHMLAEALNKNA